VFGKKPFLQSFVNTKNLTIDETFVFVLSSAQPKRLELQYQQHFFASTATITNRFP